MLAYCLAMKSRASLCLCAVLSVPSLLKLIFMDIDEDSKKALRFKGHIFYAALRFKGHIFYVTLRFKGHIFYAELQAIFFKSL